MRRLTTEKLAALCSALGFELSREFYANHHDGAIEWITNSSPRFVQRLTDPSQATDGRAEQELRRIRRKLGLIAAARLPARLLAGMITDRQRFKPRHLFALLVSAPLLPLSIAVDRYWKRKAAAEWAHRKTEPAGSAMTLFFSRKI